MATFKQNVVRYNYSFFFKNVVKFIDVYRWVGVPEKVVNVLSQLMERWKTRLEVTDKRKVKTSRWIKIRKGFLQGNSYSPVCFCLTEVPIAMMLEETDGYKIGKPGERDLKRTHSFSIDDLKVYQENQNKLEMLWCEEMCRSCLQER